MRPIVPLRAAAAGGALAGALLPPDLRASAWAGIGTLYVAVAGFGIVSLRSGIFGKATIRGESGRPEVALTFDDGPDPDATPRLLDLLAERRARATFFCIGEKVRVSPRVARRAREEGHQIGNHSFRHSKATTLFSARALRLDLERCQRAIEDAAGVRPRFYRPPYGLASRAGDRVTQDLGLETVGWQARGIDVRGSSPQRVVARLRRRLEPGAIVLLHDGRRDPEAVLEITSCLLDGLAELRLEPVALDRLLS
jgi:peptidoglycan/xylan/chitin deacetylase (PgdA/CDA1 family)